MRTRTLPPCFVALLFSLLYIAEALPAGAQDAPVTAPAQITQAIDASQLVVLKGNVHPLAQPQYDQGAVPDATPLHRMLLLLQRSAAQEGALQQLLAAQQSKSSPDFHVWLTPEQFGSQFGPNPSDVQTITSWLAAQGFHVNRLSAGRTLIEFDGTAGQVRNAFHTEIHRYMVDGQERTANAGDPEIPAALAPVVAGVVSLHNFPATSHLLGVGAFERTRKNGSIRPLVTPLTNSSASHPLFTPPFGNGQTFPVVPADFATIYNVTPLWTSGIDGTGQTIAVVGDSNINVSDIQNFRALFGLSNNFSSANVIIDGVDPGIVMDAETEADLDIEWSGAVAKNATIQFVIAEDTEVSLGSALAALYAVDHNLAGVLSESFGICEQALGSTANQYNNALWEQAAAQGITVVVSAGDAGSAGCDNFNDQAPATQGLAVNGFASTPYNIAVGGTDFDQINKWTQYWSSTNDPVTLESALGYIPEIPWNDSCAQLGLTGCGSSGPGGNSINIVAGSGGVSTLYPKPSWQSGTGVPPDNKRDLPDVALFASNGFTGSGYLICAADLGGACQSGEENFSYFLVGGTSASAPSFAGIMALINHSQQKQNLSARQGIANNVLYALARKQANTSPALNCNASASPVSGCTFNDVTSGDSFLVHTGIGNNSVACAGGSPNCSAAVTSQTGILITPANTTPKTPAYTTNTGYDLASGLGSVNAQNLAANWKSANSVSTTTKLSLNSGTAVSITHGSSVNVNITVSPTAAVGQASLVAAMPTGGNLAVGQFTLANGVASGSTSALPGGTAYTVTAHYEGDGTNAPSDSAAVPVTVAPEPSKTLLTVPTFNPNTGIETSNTPTTLVYGSPYIIRADVTNASGSLTQLCYNSNLFSCPTGSVAITDALNGGAAKPLDAGTFPLNAAGYTEDQLVQLVGGTHVLTAQYNGDNSYAKNTSSAYALTVTPAPSTLAFNPNTAATSVGVMIDLHVEMENAVIDGAAPTGTVAFFDGGVLIPGAVTVLSNPGSPNNNGTLTADLFTSLSTNGIHNITAKYSGDANYAPSNASLTVTADYLATVTLTASPSSIIFGATTTLKAIVSTNVKSPALTGSVTLSSSTGPITGTVTQTFGTDANGNTQLVATVTTAPQSSELLFANYSGDSNFSSSSASAGFSVTTPTFSIAQPPAIVITAGQTGTAALTITPTSNLASTVMLTCVGGPSGSTCAFTPSSVNLANGAVGTATISVTSIGPSPASAMVVRAHRKSLLGGLDIIRRNLLRRPASGVWISAWWTACFAAGFGALCVLFLFELRQRKRGVLAAAFAAVLLCLISFALGCGGGGGGSSIPPTPALATTTTVVSSPTPKVASQTLLTLNATVTSSKPLSGTVTFFAAGQPLSAAIPLVNGSAQTQFNPSFPGTLAITAQYSGDSNNLPSTSAPFNQVTTGTTAIGVNAQTGTFSQTTSVNVTIQ